jgi:hypothetical protein
MSSRPQIPLRALPAANPNRGGATPAEAAPLAAGSAAVNAAAAPRVESGRATNEIPANVDVKGYMGQKYSRAMPVSKLYHTRQPDAAYAALDTMFGQPTSTDVLMRTGSGDILWLQVANPEEPDNDRRRYTLVSAMNDRPDPGTGNPQGTALTHQEINGVTIEVNELLRLHPNSAGRQIVSGSRVTEIVAFNRETPLHPNLRGGAGWPESTILDDFVRVAAQARQA